MNPPFERAALVGAETHGGAGPAERGREPLHPLEGVLHPGRGEQLGPGQGLDHQTPEVVAGGHLERQPRIVPPAGQEPGQARVVLGPDVDVGPALPPGRPLGEGVAEQEGGVGEDRRVGDPVERPAQGAGRQAEAEVAQGVGLGGAEPRRHRGQVLGHRGDQDPADDLQPLAVGGPVEERAVAAADGGAVLDHRDPAEAERGEVRGQEVRLLLERPDLVLEHPLAAGLLAPGPVAARDAGGVGQVPHHQPVVGDGGPEHHQRLARHQPTERLGDGGRRAGRQPLGRLGLELDRPVDPARLDRLGHHLADPGHQRALGPGTVGQDPHHDGGGAGHAATPIPTAVHSPPSDAERRAASSARMVARPSSKVAGRGPGPGGSPPTARRNASARRM